MSRATRVHLTKTRQQHASVRRAKPGRPYNGPNLVAQKETSAKKAARKASAGRHKTAP